MKTTTLLLAIILITARVAAQDITIGTTITFDRVGAGIIGGYKKTYVAYEQGKHQIPRCNVYVKRYTAMREIHVDSSGSFNKHVVVGIAYNDFYKLCGYLPDGYTINSFDSFSIEAGVIGDITKNKKIKVVLIPSITIFHKMDRVGLSARVGIMYKI